jgi:hypothetical protein
MLGNHKASLAGSLVVALAAAGCGSSGSSSTVSSAAPATSSGASAPTAANSGAAGALAADATSAKTGDIPDTQVFLVLRNTKAGYSIKYPEGWTQLGSGRDTTFRDKNNLVRVAVTQGPPPTTASVAAQLEALRRSDPSLKFGPPQQMTIGSAPAIKAVYSTESPPNPVTGKRVLLVVDRYELTHAGKVATVDLGTPQGVDNVDAYKMMVASFRWL